MKTEQEIKTMIEKCKELRKYIPSHSIFGDDNHSQIDTEVRILTMCLEKDWDEFEIEERIEERVEVLGGEYSGDAEVRAYDWLAENDDDDLATDESIAVFKKKAGK